MTAGSATALAGSYDFDQHRRLLDLGGGTGSFLVPILERHPGIECGLFELPSVVALAGENLKAYKSGSRVRFYEGDLLRDQLPTGYGVQSRAMTAQAARRLDPANHAASELPTRDSAMPGSPQNSSSNAMTMPSPLGSNAC